MTTADTGNHEIDQQSEYTSGKEPKARLAKRSVLGQWLKALIPLSMLPFIFLFAWGLGKDPKRIPHP